MKRVLTFGVYDMMHFGHIMLFKRAKELNGQDNKLIVAVQDSKTILKYKPNTKMVNTLEERLIMISSLKYVDEVVIYNDVDIDIQKVDFDIFVKGPDQNHDGFKRAEEWCRQNGKEVVVLPRTEGISSSMLRNIKGL